MAKARIARSKPTLGAGTTVSKYDFENPDNSAVGFRLQEIAAALTLLDDLHCEALELEYSGIGASVGCTKEGLTHSLTALAIESAGQQLVKARAALHDLFREVELKPTPPKAEVA